MNTNNTVTTHNFGTEINFGTKSKSYPSKCYYCSKRVVVGGVAVCIDDIEPTGHSDTQCIHPDAL